MSDAFTDVGDHWQDDAFNRKSYARFLTTYLTSKVCGTSDAPELKPFTMALDAGWGAGKTFFLKRWKADLETNSYQREGHIVIAFDAWAADYAEDPLIAFMSELRDELVKSIRRSGISAVAKADGIRAVESATRNLRRLAMPLAGFLAKALLHKISGIDLDELPDAIKPLLNDRDAEDIGDVLDEEKAVEAIDQVFSAKLSEHAARKQAITQFKSDLQNALGILQKEGSSSAPLFILVDELDRCKPSFAVGLLEAIKHIFGVPGVCIVVATNLHQLAHTIRAVYGEGFDGSTYLQRFFDVTYALPQAEGPNLLAVWLKARPILLSKPCRYATPRHGFNIDPFGAGPEGLLAWIFNGLGLSIRAQGQVLELMEAAALGIESGRKIHVAWLAFICAIWHQHRHYFEHFERHTKYGESAADSYLRLGAAVGRRTYQTFVHTSQSMQEQQTTLKELVSAYSSLGALDLIALRDRFDPNTFTYEALIAREVLEDAPNSFTLGVRYPSDLLHYFNLVRTAGHLRPSTVL